MAKVIFKDQVYGSTDTVWIGTKAEYENAKSSIPDGYTVILTDDQTMGNLVIDDEVKSGSKNPVTSDAVYKSLNSAMDSKENKLQYSSGQFTLNSTYVTKGTVSWFKLGRVVIVQLNSVWLTEWSDGDKTLSTNTAPKPMVHSYGSIPPLNGETEPQLFAVTPQGYLQANGGMSHIGEFYGSFTYIAQS